jgi:hypothetical protein
MVETVRFRPQNSLLNDPLCVVSSNQWVYVCCLVCDLLKCLAKTLVSTTCSYTEYIILMSGKKYQMPPLFAQ